jgi:anti-sigma B factor antagonist
LEFKLATADLGNGVSTVSVAGEVDLATAPELKEALAEVINDGARGVLVDLSNATFIDSTTLGVLMGAVKRLRPAGGELAIACHDPNIRKIFEITLLDRVFEIFDTPGAAVEHLQGVGAAAASDLSPRG